MANVNMVRITDNILRSTPITDGSFYFNVSQQTIHLDYGDERLTLGNFAVVNALTDLPAAQDTQDNLFYFVIADSTLYRTDGAIWLPINSKVDVPTGMLKGNANNEIVQAVAGTDYISPTSGGTMTAPLIGMENPDSTFQLRNFGLGDTLPPTVPNGWVYGVYE